MCLVKNTFKIEIFKTYILILMIFNLNIVDLTIDITS